MGWSEDTTSYLTFAENDYRWFQDSYESGSYYPGLAGLGQNICERYLKHLINEYYEPENEAEEHRQVDTLRAHSLAKLVRFIEGEMKIDVPEEIEDKLYSIDGFYFSTRYPGDESMIPGERDIDRVAKAVTAVRNYTLDLIHSFEHETTQEPQDMNNMYDDWER